MDRFIVLVMLICYEHFINLKSNMDRFIDVIETTEKRFYVKFKIQYG